MPMFTNSPALRWAIPAVTAAAVIGGGAAVGTLTASADPDLPPRTAAELLVDLQTARLDGLSGTVVQRADLGLPNLPVQTGDRSSDLGSLIAGKHTLRVWYAGPDQARVALLGRLGESDIILNKQDVWIWSSRDNTYAHKRLSSSERKARPNPLPLTPQQAAEAALAAIDPSTVVSTAGSARVAGRDAYEMVLAPRDNASLVGQVRFAIDAEEHVPLRAQVYAKGATDPAIEVQFTEIDFDRPDAAQFAFTPPPGAKEEQIDKLTLPFARGMAPAGGKVVGSGWTSVLVGPAPAGLASARGQAQGQFDGLQQILPRVSGSWGSGRLLSGKLFSVLITDDGRVLIGLVSPERLYQVAADPAAKVTTR